MVHDIKQIESLTAYIENHFDKSVPYVELINSWVSMAGIGIHDAETINYYIALIPMIEKKIEEAGLHEI